MSPRTDPSDSDPRPELSNEYLLSLVAATAVVLLMIFWIAPMIGNPHQLSARTPYIFAWVIAGGVTISNGLTDFSGDATETLGVPVLVAVLFGMLIVGVVAPTLTLKLMRSESTAAPLRQGSRAFYLFGLVIAATYALMVAPTGYISWNVARSLHAAQAVQRNKDLMINDLNVIAMRLREYQALPKRLGGGEGSTAGFELNGDLSRTDEGSYFVEARSDGAFVTARSLKYEGAGIAVNIDRNGLMTGWSYEGKFQ